MVAAEAIKDPHSLSVQSNYNGKVVQDGNTRYVCLLESITDTFEAVLMMI